MNSGSGVKWTMVLLVVSFYKSRLEIDFNEPASPGKKLNFLICHGLKNLWLKISTTSPILGCPQIKSTEQLVSGKMYPL